MKFEKTNVYNIDGALRGMRNPMNSWDRGDSYYDDSGEFVLGDNDIALARKLVRGGAEHRKFLRQILVCVDITAPRYWWIEFDTYKIGTTSNSCSTMHKLNAEPLNVDMFQFLRMRQQKSFWTE